VNHSMLQVAILGVFIRHVAAQREEEDGSPLRRPGELVFNDSDITWGSR
jgi:hypothetical protein